MFLKSKEKKKVKTFLLQKVHAVIFFLFSQVDDKVRALRSIPGFASKIGTKLKLTTSVVVVLSDF